jgi:hypothetical protein
VWGKRSRPVLPDDSAYVHVLRESACPGPLILHVQMDGQDVAQLEKGQNTRIQLAPGEHRMHVRPWKVAMRNTAEQEQSLTLQPSEELDVMIKCRLRGLFQKDVIEIAETPWRGKVRNGQPVARVSTVDWSRYQFYVVETGLRQEWTGSSSFTEDNRGSDVAARRQRTVETEWSRGVSLGGSTDRTRSVAAGLGIGWLTLQSQVETTVSHWFSLQQSERCRIEQVLELEIPARTFVQVTVVWKTLWQEGVVRVVGPRGPAPDVPFRFVHSREFDRYTTTTPR